MKELAAIPGSDRRPLLQQRMDDGLLGRKTGAGFYEYRDGRAKIDAEPPAPDYDGRPVWAGSDELSSLVASLDATLDKGAEPGNDSLILVAPLGDSAAKTAANSGLGCLEDKLGEKHRSCYTFHLGENHENF